jgi:hypothetical protein
LTTATGAGSTAGLVSAAIALWDRRSAVQPLDVAASKGFDTCFNTAGHAVMSFFLFFLLL